MRVPNARSPVGSIGGKRRKIRSCRGSGPHRRIERRPPAACRRRAFDLRRAGGWAVSPRPAWWRDEGTTDAGVGSLPRRHRRRCSPCSPETPMPRRRCPAWSTARARGRRVPAGQSPGCASRWQRHARAGRPPRRVAAGSPSARAWHGWPKRRNGSVRPEWRGAAPGTARFCSSVAHAAARRRRWGAISARSTIW